MFEILNFRYKSSSFLNNLTSSSVHSPWRIQTEILDGVSHLFQIHMNFLLCF